MPKDLLSLDETARRRDDALCDGVGELLASIYGWFTEGFGTPDLVEAKALLEQLE